MARTGTHGAGGTARLATTCGRIALLLAASVPAIGRAASGPCGDPWINQAFEQMYHRAPVGSGKNVGECDITRYGNGHWSSYPDLMTKISQHQGSAQTSSTGSRLVGSGNAGGASVIGGSQAMNGGSLLGAGAAGNGNAGGKSLLGGNPGGASVINTNGSNIVAQGGGNIVEQGGGNIVAQGGGNLAGRSLQSVDKPRASPGRYLVVPGGNLVDANGNVVRQAGTYLLVAKSGGYGIGIGIGAGARAPTAGTVVLP